MSKTFTELFNGLKGRAINGKIYVSQIEHDEYETMLQPQERTIPLKAGDDVLEIVKTVNKQDGDRTLYAYEPPLGRRMLSLGYFKTEAECVEAVRTYKEANGITW